MILNYFFQDVANQAYTLHEVVNEIRDKATKERLQVLPYDLKFKEPSSENIKQGQSQNNV